MQDRGGEVYKCLWLIDEHRLSGYLNFLLPSPEWLSLPFGRTPIMGVVLVV